MGQAAPKPRIRRILVALDASGSSLEALGTAARLAAELQADLEGLFVEDTDLLSFAELPFASVTAAWFGGARHVQTDELQRSVRLQAQRAREAIARAASAAGVSWTFQVARGNVQRVLLEAAERADLLSLGLVGVSAARRAGGGSVAHRAARAAPRSVLIVRQVAPSDAGVVALLHTQAGVTAVLEAAVGTAKANRRSLTVVVSHGQPARAGILSNAHRIVAPHKLSVHWLEATGSNPAAALNQALRAARGGLLVIEADHPLLHDQRLEEILDRGGCSLLLLR